MSCPSLGRIVFATVCAVNAAGCTQLSIPESSPFAADELQPQFEPATLDEVIAREIPKGTTVADARRIMEREGFQCNLIPVIRSDKLRDGMHKGKFTVLRCERSDPFHFGVSQSTTVTFEMEQRSSENMPETVAIARTETWFVPKQDGDVETK